MSKYLTLLVMLAITVPLFSQKLLTADSAAKLREVIIVYQANKNTPVSFQNIEAKELKSRSVGQEPSFLLAETPSVTAYADAGSTQGYAYYRMRGIDQTRINTTLDGVPMNEPEDQGAYFSNYPDILNSVSKLQIQRGAGTSKNGVASYGGSIQLLSPDLHDTARVTFGLGYGSFNSSRVFGEYNSGIRNHKAFYMRASQVYSDGYKYNSSNNARSAFASAGWFYDKSTWRITILAGQQRNKLAWLGVTDSLIRADPKTNANANEKDRFAQGMLQLQQVWRPAAHTVLQSSIYYTFLKGNYDFNLNNFLGLPSTNELYNYAFQSNLLGFFSNCSFTGRNLTLISGVHGNIYNRQHLGSELSAGQLYKNKGFKNEVSVFSKLAYLSGPLSFFADVQYRHSSFDYSGSVSFNELHWKFLNPTSGISLQVDPRSILYYSIGSTGREPTRNDLFGGNDDLLADSTGAAILSIKIPEYVTDHELGFRHQDGKLNLSVNLYYMDFKNEIVLDGKFGPNGLALTNKVERSFRSGLEWTLSYKISRYFSFTNNSSLNYSRIKEQQEVFAPILTPPVILNQEFRYANNNFSFHVSARYQQRSYIDFANTTEVRSYFLLNATIGYRIKGIELNVFANNITNTSYYNNGYVDYDGSRKYFVQAPANFYTSLKYSF